MMQNERRTKVLITGGSSYLGQHLVPLALADYEVCYTYYANDPLKLPQGVQVDIRDETAVLACCRAFAPDAIIHLAGSGRTADKTAVIELGAKHIVQAAREYDARLIHLSTDVVFDGTTGPYKETDPLTPVHEYGRAKTNAEAIVAHYADHVIVRTSLIYGLTIKDRGMEWVEAALVAGEPVTLFSNQYRNPVEANTLSRACLELITHSYTGILHIAGAELVSRADFTERLLDWWGVEQRQTLTIGSDESGCWPLNTCLDVSLAQSLLETALLGVTAVLDAAKVTNFK